MNVGKGMRPEEYVADPLVYEVAAITRWAREHLDEYDFAYWTSRLFDPAMHWLKNITSMEAEVLNRQNQIDEGRLESDPGQEE